MNIETNQPSPPQDVATKTRLPTTMPCPKDELAAKGTGSPSARIRAAKLALFVEEYLNANFNGTKAAIAVGYSAKSARVKASELLALPVVLSGIEASIRARAARTSLNTDDIVLRMHAIALANASELVAVHCNCCRYCYGKGHHYQWTQNEMREAQSAYAIAKVQARGDVDALNRLRRPDVEGGSGFNGAAEPNPECPECFGQGIARVVIKDTRDLSPSARLLYAGIKETSYGADVQMHNQAAMLTNVAKHLGMFTTNVAINGYVGYD